MRILAIALTFAALTLAASGHADEVKHDVIDIHHLPLGDGRIGDTAKRGFVMTCSRGPGRGGGAQVAGPWIHGDTWDLSEKIHVQGNVTWPAAQFSIREVDGGRVVERVIKGNGLPVKTPTGTFPISPTDRAFQIDRNPNSIRAADFSLDLPLDPREAAAPSCVTMGMIGVALNGVAIFNALDDLNRDAMAHEVLDLCNGHPQIEGEYHYHGPSPCLPSATANEQLIGYALDGFGIYSIYDAGGTELTNADLDECHGRVSAVDWNGKHGAIYHYVLTREYPYTIGCFRGTPLRLPPPLGGPPGGPRGPGGFRPPPGPPGGPPFRP